MPKVRFLQFYKNGMVGLDVAPEQVVEVTDDQLAYILTDVRNPRESVEILDAKKAKPAKAGKAEPGVDEG